ncbi:MAG: fluoride efflux transporter FluC [Phycisphaerales bacterium JB040]
MLNVLLVFVGGGVGAVLRYLASLGVGAALRGVTHDDAGIPREDAAIGLVPWATFGVNVVGCLLIGLLVPLLAGQVEGGDHRMRLLLVVGVLGGFTTFSAFGHETVTLIQHGRTGIALGYVAASVVAGLAAVLLGQTLSGK